MKKQLILLFFLLPAAPYRALCGAPAGGRSSALAGSSVTFTDVWALQNNQAGLAFLKKSAAGISCVSRFLIKELATTAFQIALVSKYATFGAGIEYFGYSAYNEQKSGIAMARKFGEKSAAGLRLNCHTTHTGEYGKRVYYTVEAGFLAKVHKQLVLGFHLFNPYSAHAATSHSERIPLIAKAGLDYEASSGVHVLVETEQSAGMPASVKGGIEYQVHPVLSLRGGVSSHPAIAAFGCGILCKSLKIDLAVDHHPYLGMSPHISLEYGF